eukprot:TRINITY_DN21021_c0_g1_i1.p1 TRINITY_DN21021_c0_g1~~TRINITY_DN21021_c0_g1_i1.p1  ORF type:complete len:543 (+),score=74.92 TRINITY_DN21021_c0_g1_i1:335-1963(+)
MTGTARAPAARAGLSDVVIITPSSINPPIIPPPPAPPAIVPSPVLERNPLSQATICAHAGLPRRTVEAALRQESLAQSAAQHLASSSVSPPILSSSLLTSSLLSSSAPVPFVTSVGKGRAPVPQTTPLFLASAFDFDSVTGSLPALDGGGEYFHRRNGNPNEKELGDAVAALEKAEAGLATSTGRGAIVAAVLSVCCAGDAVLCQEDAFRGTDSFLRSDLPRFGIDVMFEDIPDADVLEVLLSRQLAPAEPAMSRLNDTSAGEVAQGADEESQLPPPPPSPRPPVNERPARCLVMVESISDPGLRVTDVQAMAATCRKWGAFLLVDNTFATPIRERPLTQGAHLVVHSVTRFLGGHSDLMAGALVGPASLIAPATRLSARWGFTAAPMDAWLAVRGIRTLQVRMERSWASAAELAVRLRSHPLCLSVTSLDRCAVLCFEVHNGFWGADSAVTAFQMLALSTSLGGVVSTVSHPCTSSHKSLSAAERTKWGIRDGCFRLSVGVEDVDDIWRDLERGLQEAACLAAHAKHQKVARVFYSNEEVY